jgi:hypothetical protein
MCSLLTLPHLNLALNWCVDSSRLLCSLVALLYACSSQEVSPDSQGVPRAVSSRGLHIMSICTHTKQQQQQCNSTMWQRTPWQGPAGCQQQLPWQMASTKQIAATAKSAHA